jgi:hypothetical protein
MDRGWRCVRKCVWYCHHFSHFIITTLLASEWFQMPHIDFLSFGFGKSEFFFPPSSHCNRRQNIRKALAYAFQKRPTERNVILVYCLALWNVRCSAELFCLWFSCLTLHRLPL